MGDIERMRAEYLQSAGAVSDSYTVASDRLGLNTIGNGREVGWNTDRLVDMAQKLRQGIADGATWHPDAVGGDYLRRESSGDDVDNIRMQCLRLAMRTVCAHPEDVVAAATKFFDFIYPKVEISGGSVAITTGYTLID